MREQKRGKGKMKREGGCVTCYCMCYTEMILHCDGRRHLSEAVKVPMNHTALSLFLSLSLSVYILLSLSIFLFSPFGTRPVCASLSLFSVCFSAVTCTCLGALSATWDVPESNEVHLSPFSHLYTLPATCCFYLPLCPYAGFSYSVCSSLTAGSHHSVDVLKNTSSSHSNKRHFREAHTLSLII